MGAGDKRSLGGDQALLDGVLQFADVARPGVPPPLAGVSSYLEVLDTDRQLFQAELDLTLSQRDELAGFVSLYKALGGGWQVAEAEPPKG